MGADREARKERRPSGRTQPERRPERPDPVPGEVRFVQPGSVPQGAR